MREPSFEHDGWRLDNAETKRILHPETFSIPPAFVRYGLWVGDMAQLIFEFHDPEQAYPERERMWVVAREVLASGYIGVLNNAPGSVEENGDFWLGDEVPFSGRHVIDAQEATEASVKVAEERPRKSWPRD